MPVQLDEISAPLVQPGGHKSAPKLGAGFAGLLDAASGVALSLAKPTAQANPPWTARQITAALLTAAQPGVAAQPSSLPETTLLAPMPGSPDVATNPTGTAWPDTATMPVPAAKSAGQHAAKTGDTARRDAAGPSTTAPAALAENVALAQAAILLNPAAPMPPLSAAPGVPSADLAPAGTEIRSAPGTEDLATASLKPLDQAGSETPAAPAWPNTDNPVPAGPPPTEVPAGTATTGPAPATTDTLRPAPAGQQARGEALAPQAVPPSGGTQILPEPAFAVALVGAAVPHATARVAAARQAVGPSAPAPAAGTPPDSDARIKPASTLVAPSEVGRPEPVAVSLVRPIMPAEAAANGGLAVLFAAPAALQDPAGAVHPGAANPPSAMPSMDVQATASSPPLMAAVPQPEPQAAGVPSLSLSTEVPAELLKQALPAAVSPWVAVMQAARPVAAAIPPASILPKPEGARQDARAAQGRAAPGGVTAIGGREAMGPSAGAPPRQSATQPDTAEPVVQADIEPMQPASQATPEAVPGAAGGALALPAASQAHTGPAATAAAAAPLPVTPADKREVTIPTGHAAMPVATTDFPVVDNPAIAVAAAPAASPTTPEAAAPPAVPMSPHAAQPQPPLLQLAQAAAGVTLGTDGAGHVTIRLAPAELGQVEIRIAHAPSGASVQIAAERADTLAALKTDLGHLHQALDRAGVAATRNVSFELTPASDSQAAPGLGLGSGFTQQDGAQQQARQDRQPTHAYAQAAPVADPGADFAPLRAASLPDETGLNITA